MPKPARPSLTARSRPRFASIFRYALTPFNAICEREDGGIRHDKGLISFMEITGITISVYRAATTTR